MRCVWCFYWSFIKLSHFSFIRWLSECCFETSEILSSSINFIIWAGRNLLLMLCCCYLLMTSDCKSRTFLLSFHQCRNTLVIDYSNINLNSIYRQCIIQHFKLVAFYMDINKSVLISYNLIYLLYQIGQSQFFASTADDSQLIWFRLFYKTSLVYFLLKT